jgi:hypothetical protein
MSFHHIADRVTPSGTWKVRWQALASTAPVLLALSGLFLTFFGLWDAARMLPAGEQSLVQFSAYPTLAIFLFLLASVQEFDRSFSIRPRLVVQALVAGVLWLGSALIGLLNIIVIRDLTIAAVVALGGSRAEAVPVTIISVMLAVLLYIGVVIGGADHHFRNLGQAGSWKLFSFTLLGQLFLLILPYLLMPYLMS